METAINEVLYAQGYNDGYWIQYAEPEIAKELHQEEIDIRNDYLLGFQAGLEPTKEHILKQEFDKLRNNADDIEFDREM